MVWSCSTLHKRDHSQACANSRLSSAKLNGVYIAHWAGIYRDGSLSCFPLCLQSCYARDILQPRGYWFHPNWTGMLFKPGEEAESGHWHTSLRWVGHHPTRCCRHPPRHRERPMEWCVIRGQARNVGVLHHWGAPQQHRNGERDPVQRQEGRPASRTEWDAPGSANK